MRRCVLKEFKQQRLPETKCSTCGEPVSAATNIANEAAPKPHDWSLCINCGALAKFTDELKLRVPTAAEIGELPSDQRAEIQRIQRNITLRNGRAVLDLPDTPANRAKAEALLRQRQAAMEPAAILLYTPSKTKDRS